jgi:hypothetical protein
MNKLGMIIDTAHCSAETPEGVLSEIKAPVTFSPTGAYAVPAVTPFGGQRIARHRREKRRYRHLAASAPPRHLLTTF